MDPLWLSNARGELGVQEFAGTPDNPSQYWSVGGMQLIATPGFQAPPSNDAGWLAHLGVMVDDLDAALFAASSWGVKTLPQGDNWLQLPDGLALHTHGPGVFHTRDKAIRSVGDVRGMKLRGPSRQVTKMLGYLGAIPVGMPLPAIPDALSKGTIDGCVLPWEVVPSVKVQELARFHSDFDPAGGALYTATFVMAMNKARYQGLPPDLRKVIDDNSGLATSAWLGRLQQANDPAGRRSAEARGNTLYTIPPAEAQEFRRKARLVEAEWIEDLNRRGLDGRALLDAARSLIDKHGKAAAPQVRGRKA